MQNQGGRDMSYNSAGMGGQGYQSMSHNAGDEMTGGQAQIRKDECLNQESRNSSQNTNFIQQTGESVMSMAQGAATIAQGAVQGAANMAQGAAVGAANMAQGAASAVKNTLGINTSDNTNTNIPSKPNTRI